MNEINLKKCNFLKRVLDISGAPNLKKVNFDGCKNLIEVHDSVGLLDKLCFLSARNCTKLEIFPEAIMSTSLETLDLYKCFSLESVPVMVGVMEKISGFSVKAGFHVSLTRALLDHSFPVTWGPWDYPLSGALSLSTGFSMLPKVEKIIGGFPHLRKSKVQDHERVSSIVSLNVEFLRIDGCNCRISYDPTWPPEHECLSSLPLYFPNSQVLQLSSDCGVYNPRWRPYFNMNSSGQEFNNLVDEFVFTYLHWFPKLHELDLSRINFTILPECINECQFLRYLRLDYCKQLQEIRGIPPNIESLSATDCISLNAYSQSILLSQVRFLCFIGYNYYIGLCVCF